MISLNGKYFTTFHQNNTNYSCLSFRHYLLYGPPNTPYHNGIYHGKLRFPPEYPFRPPSFYMITPNGRFETNTKICLSISDYHPNSWNPTWNMSTILTALLSFMTENRMTTGALHSTDSYKRMMARKTLSWNLKNPQFVELFPEVAEVSFCSIVNVIQLTF